MNFKTVLTPFINYKLNTTSSKNTPFGGFIYLFSEKHFKNFKKTILPIVETHSMAIGKNRILENEQKFVHFQGVFGPVWIGFIAKGVSQNVGDVIESNYGAAKDLAAIVSTSLKQQKIKSVSIDMTALSFDEVEGFLTGLELSSYQFLNIYQNKSKVELTAALKVPKKFQQKDLDNILKLAVSLQVSRHLINLPPNLIHPESVEKIILNELPYSKRSRITVWDYEKCKKNGLELLCAVGQGAKYKPRLIHIQYRPLKKSTKKPIAFVGKGITFDTGGLDLKPSSGMRLMKKDMGGSAAIVGLSLWADFVQLDRPCDFYLALAENSVDADSMRPSDIYKSKAGFDVEIDNTDAEGRLVLADAMTVALQHKEKPETLIDVATLTGAIKVALGSEVAGLFSNNDQLANKLYQAGQKMGEPNWRMPLYKKYMNSLNSQFADFKNSGEGFGGAITAALFLEKFAPDVKWAHLDVYCWSDKAQGGLTAGSANPQPVQTLAHFLSEL